MLTPDHEADVFWSFILLLVIASFTAYYASRKGRNPYIWFFVGALLGIFAPLILLALPDATHEKVEQLGEPSMAVSHPDPSLKEQTSSFPLPDEKRHPEEDRLWFYLDQAHQQMGPVSIIALRELWNTGRLELTSYVWSEGMTQWAKVEDLVDLREALSRRV